MLVIHKLYTLFAPENHCMLVVFSYPHRNGAENSDCANMQYMCLCTSMLSAKPCDSQSILP